MAAKTVKDFRRLTKCPRCGGFTKSMKERNVPRSRLYHCTHSFKNWKAYQASVRDSQETQIGGKNEPIKLEIKTFSCSCPICFFGAYYLADTGEECDSMGRRMGKRRWKKVPSKPFRKK